MATRRSTKGRRHGPGAGGIRGERILALFLVMLPVLSYAGCRPGAGEDQAGGEAPKRVVHPKAGSLLVHAQDVLHAGRYDLALAFADSAQHIDPSLPEIYFMRGLVYSELRRFEEARQQYGKALALDPAYKGARLNMGNDAFRQGEHRQALRYYLEEEDVHPSPEVFLQIGYAYENLNEADSARWAYQRAITADDCFAAAYARLGQLYGSEGEYEQALAHAQKALHLDPDNMSYQYFKGYLLQQTGKPEEALGYLSRVTKERPWHYGAHYHLGQALMQLGKPEQAQSYLARADTLQQLDSDLNMLQWRAGTYSDKPDSWISLGESFRQMGRVDEALEAYRVALYLDPGNLELQSNVATLALMNGEAQEAVMRYEEILKQDSTLAEVWLNLGIAYASTGERARARRAWHAVLEYSPQHPVAKKYLARFSGKTSGS